MVEKNYYLEEFSKGREHLERGFVQSLQKPKNVFAAFITAVALPAFFYIGLKKDFVRCGFFFFRFFFSFLFLFFFFRKTSLNRQDDER